MAGVVSYFYHKQGRSVWFSLILALLAERIVLIAAIYLIVPLFQLPAELLTITAFTMTLPGIVLQLILVPLLVMLVKRAQHQQ